MKKKFILLLFVIALIATMFSLAACSDSFDDLTIETEDVTDAPVGENTLRYSIPDYENKKDKYNLTVTLRLYLSFLFPITRIKKTSTISA